MNPAALRSLAPGLLVASLMLAAGGLLLWASWQDLQQAENDNRLAQRAAQLSQVRYERVQRDEPQIRRTLGQLDKLLEGGLVGTDQRLDWADRMRNVARQRRIDGLSFEIAPQRKLGHLDLKDEYPVFASSMHIDAKLLHEGDLLRLLDDLRLPVPGQALPTRCLLERLTPTPNETNSVRMQCDIAWLSIEPPPARTGATP